MANSWGLVDAQMGDSNKESIYNSLIESLIMGLGEPLTVTFPSDAHYTPTYSPPATPGVMVAFRLNVTSSGSLTTTKNLVLPLKKKMWVINNGTTGGRPIQVIGATGTGVTIPTGEQDLIYCDGTNFLRVGQAKSIDVQVFTASGTWTKPNGAKFVDVALIGGGGGGGSGRKGAAASTRFGGGGGGGGGISRQRFLASVMGATETVTVGTGGTGGVSQTTNSTDGNTGIDGGTSVFSVANYLTAMGGVRGSEGSAASGSAGTGGVGSVDGQATTGGAGGAGSSSTGTAAAGAATGDNTPRGGGGGGGISSGNTEAAGGAGGAFTVTRTLTGGAAGSTGSPPGIVGNSLPTSDGWSCGSGGGGGAGKRTGTPGVGGQGGIYGAGGGGGGAAENSATNSGAGGAGRDGVCVVISYF